MQNLVKNGQMVTVTEGAAKQFIKMGFRPVEPVVLPKVAAPIKTEEQSYPKAIADWTDKMVREYCSKHMLTDSNKILHLRKVVKETLGLEGPLLKNWVNLKAGEKTYKEVKEEQENGQS